MADKLIYFPTKLTSVNFKQVFTGFMWAPWGGGGVRYYVLRNDRRDDNLSVSLNSDLEFSVTIRFWTDIYLYSTHLKSQDLRNSRQNEYVEYFKV